MSIISEISVAKLKDDCTEILAKLDKNDPKVKSLETSMYEAITEVKPSKMRNVLAELQTLAGKK